MNMIDGVMEIETPAGKLRIIPRGEQGAYPGVHIYLAGELVSVVEYDEEKENIQTCCYDKENEEPVNITEFK